MCMLVGFYASIAFRNLSSASSASFSAAFTNTPIPFLPLPHRRRSNAMSRVYERKCNRAISPMNAYIYSVPRRHWRSLPPTVTRVFLHCCSSVSSSSLLPFPPLPSLCPPRYALISNIISFSVKLFVLMIIVSVRVSISKTSANRLKNIQRLRA